MSGLGMSVRTPPSARKNAKATDGESLCLFCYMGGKLSPADRLHLLFSLRTLRAHINKNHLPIKAS